MAITAKEIAAATGFSIPTVYEALRGSGRMRDATRQTILDTAKRLGYRPSRAAVNMRIGRHRAIGMPIRVWHALPQPLLLEIMAQLNDRGQLLLCEYMRGHRDRMPRMLTEDCIDGLIVLEDLPKALEDELSQQQLPVVRVNTNKRNKPGCITFDERSAMQDIVRLLVERDRRHVVYCFMGDKDTHYSAKERWRYLQRYLAEAGRSAPVRLSGKMMSWEQTVHETELLDYVRSHPEVDAIVCYADIMAPLAMHVGQVLGRSVPKQLSVVSFNDTSFARSTEPKISTMAIPSEELARATVDAILQHIEQGQPASPRTLRYRLTRETSL